MLRHRALPAYPHGGYPLGRRDNAAAWPFTSDNIHYVNTRSRQNAAPRDRAHRRLRRPALVHPQRTQSAPQRRQ